MTNHRRLRPTRRSGRAACQPLRRQQSGQKRALRPPASTAAGPNRRGLQPPKRRPSPHSRRLPRVSDAMSEGGDAKRMQQLRQQQQRPFYACGKNQRRGGRRRGRRRALSQRSRSQTQKLSEKMPTEVGPQQASGTPQTAPPSTKHSAAASAGRGPYNDKAPAPSPQPLTAVGLRTSLLQPPHSPLAGTARCWGSKKGSCRSTARLNNH